MSSEFLDLKFPGSDMGRTAIRNVTIIPMDSRRTLPNHTILFEAGKILAISPSGEMQIDEDVAVIDGGGRFLMPGLADMYTHYRDPAESPLYLAYGITTARTSSNAFQLAMAQAAARRDFPSPRMITVTPGIDGIGPNGRTDMYDGYPLTRPEDAKDLVRHFAGRGYDQIMPFSLLSKEVLTALGEASAEQGMRLAGNCPNAVSWEEAVEVGMSGFHQCHLVARDHMLDAHAGQTYWDRFDPAPGTKLDFDKIRRLGAFLAAHDAWSLPTLAFHQRAARPLEVSLADPDLRYVPQSTINDWETTIIRWSHRGRIDAVAWRSLAQRRAEAFHRMIGIFHEEGAPQLTCTDGINPYNIQGPVLLEEIENFASAGMGAFDALRCATSEAARFMHEEDLWGTIAVGKYADMILLRDNPLEDLRALRTVDEVFVNGHHLDRTVLDSLLEQRAALAKKGAPSVAATTLPAAAGSGEVVDEGIWQERICDAEFGQVGYRHSRLSNGGWLIEERHSGANPRRHPQRQTSLLTLDENMNVQHGEIEIESFVGKETTTISWSDGMGYRQRHTAMDGMETEAVLPGAPRVPGEALSLSFLPRIVARHGTARVPALDVEGPSLGATELAIAPADETGVAADDGLWRVDVSRLGQRASKTYRLTAEGKLIDMKETTTLLWPRELQPIEPAL
ncbi:amidohydrolase family protein [Pelagibacterium lacus]|uniref:Amidohydrolase-related domain-containing protein n=1 Tax=Pelagibacterium lacus TaxID=2282655 RepID=A0A369W4D0_9HYPH|nr:amidohydrolase family protein [Pelagibacterium lacus]RDE09556.1 hypothetical protein DVH29_05185 [Pelagibacterium lacus]